ncbi:AraC family transcriptional regulator [Erysipelothrix sp. HDW6C]|nr:AraC family transcriptional regulator [Erysipelothrix sp. HDW6C]
MLESFNDVIEYIENHLLDEIHKQEIEKISGYSDYHFKRVFMFLTGLSLNEYIRKRKLSLATQDLIAGQKVTEVAFNYGYNSSDGFSNAFQEWSGVRPSEISMTTNQYFFPKLEFSYTLKGGISMEFRIEMKEAFNIIGVTKRIALQFEGENEEIINLAQSITQEQREAMHSVGNLYPHQVINASFNFDGRDSDKDGSLEHMIGFLSTNIMGREDLVQIHVAKQLWAVFPITGSFPQSLQDTWARIFSEWLPASSYELVEAPEISFSNYNDPPHARYSEIWIAIQKK